MAGKAKNYFDKFKFQVVINGVSEAAFSKCSGLKANVEKVEHREGGAIRADKHAGLVSYEDITLERGLTDNAALADWFKKVYDAASDAGGATPADYKKDFTINQLDRKGSIIKSWEVYGAFVTSYTPGEWDNSANEVAIESVTLCIDYFE